MDPEKAMAQNAARQKSRKLKQLLEDPQSEEHQLLVAAETDNMSLDELRMVWVTANLYQRVFEAQRRSIDNRDEFFVPRPEGKEDGVIPPSHDDLNQYEIEREAQEKERLQGLLDQQTVIYNELMAKANEMSEETVKAIIQPLIIDQLTSREWNNQYGMQVLVRCTFLDEDLTQRAYQTVEEAQRLLNTKNGQKVLESLLNEHRGLMLDPDLLGN
jgi:hypothetical protein